MTVDADGYVAQLVTDYELVLNIGSDQGVKPGDVFEVLDKATMNVRDPNTHEVLGSIKRVKARVEVRRTTERLSIARVVKRTRPLGSLLSGEPSPVLTPSVWPEGVVVGDPVVSVDEE